MTIFSWASARVLSGLCLAALLLAPNSPLHASDHADPVELPILKLLDDAQPDEGETRRLSGGITDLIVFPVDDKDMAVSFPRWNDKSLPFSREERDKLVALSSAQRADLQKLPRSKRSAALQALTAPPAPGFPPLNREELARLERLTPVERFEMQTLTAEERAKIKALVIILCVRRALTPEAPVLDLEPYTYSIFMDPDAAMRFEAPPEPAADFTKVYSERARYGGSLPEPEKIAPSIEFHFQLNSDGTLKDFKTSGLLQNPGQKPLITFPAGTASGIRDDPFIFPPFFRTNVVAMAVKVPIESFAPNKRRWAIWAGSYRDGKKIDHVGRSLRTQQPRFARLFNALEPRDQVAAFDRDRENPDFLRDLLMRSGVPALFNYRNWDRVPDVMIYNTAFDARYPNGRLLTDDVAAELAENGDALLQELSFVGDTWPRATQNDKPFVAAFPYLANPWTVEERMAKPGPVNPPDLTDPLALSMRNKTFIVLGVAGTVIVLFGLGLLSGHWLGARQRRREEARELRPSTATDGVK